MERINLTETTYYSGVDEYPSKLDGIFLKGKAELEEDIKFRLADPVRNIGLSTRLTIDEVEQIRDCLMKMLDRLAHFEIPNLSGQYWRYSYTLSGTGIELQMEHLSCIIVTHSDEEYHTEFADQSIPVLSVNCRLLTVDEYAKKKNVENVTVRQWIRRGKISSAFKQGSEWLIPELASVSQGNYQEKMYVLPSDLQNIPEHFQYLKNIATVNIRRNPGGDSFKIKLTPRYSGNETCQIVDEISSGEREKLELYLISESTIKPVDGTVTIVGKRIPGTGAGVVINNIE